MKTLHLLRHAKSSWDRPDLADRERPLNGRGRRAASRMGAALRELLMDTPPVAISPARRAQQTLEGLALGWPELAAAEHRTEEDLYTFSAHDLLSWLVLQDDALPELLLVGHNPALTDLVNMLCPQQYLGNLPTAGYVQLTLEIAAWRELPAATAEVRQRLFPKQL